MIVSGPWATTSNSRMVVEPDFDLVHLDVREGSDWVTLVDGHLLPDDPTRFTLHYAGSVVTTGEYLTGADAGPALPFFKPGREYVRAVSGPADYSERFQVLSVAARPDYGLVAFGFATLLGSRWHPCHKTLIHFSSGRWSEVIPDVDVQSGRGAGGVA